MGARPTIYDVARAAGVAASTVSRAYARPGRVRAETARRIFEAAEQVGYRSARPDVRPPPLGATRAIGLVVADITNPFYGAIIQGASEAARSLGHLLILSHTSESPEAERRTIEQELPYVDGLVLASSRMSDAAVRTIAQQRPVVMLNRRLPEVSCVVVDDAQGVRHAAEHLRDLGHRSVLYVAGPESSWSDGLRWRSLYDLGRQLGLSVRRTGAHEPTVRAGVEAARQVSLCGTTAVIAYNDQLAIGVVKGLRSLGCGVPDDVSVIGFDNIVFSEIVEPELTTVAAPLQHLGDTAVRNCIALARGARAQGPGLVLPMTLVRRASTAPPSPGRG